MSHPFMQRIMRLLKSFIVWICFIPVAILNGGLREYVLVKFIGEETALPVSGILLSAFIFLVTWLMLPRLVKRLWHERLSGNRCLLGVIDRSLRVCHRNYRRQYHYGNSCRLQSIDGQSVGACIGDDITVTCAAENVQTDLI